MIKEDTPKLKSQKEIYFKIVQASDVYTSDELEENFLKGFIARTSLLWHNFRGVFEDITRSEALSAMYIGQDRAHQRKGLHNWHKQKLARMCTIWDDVGTYLTSSIDPKEKVILTVAFAHFKKEGKQ